MSTLTLKELEEILELFGKSELSEIHLGRFDEKISETLPELLSLARRQLEQEAVGKREAPSCSDQTKDCAVPDVGPLGEVMRSGADIYFKDEIGDPAFMMGTRTGVEIGLEDGASVAFTKDQLPLLIAHLQSWLDHGTFELKPQPVQGDSDNTGPQDYPASAFFC